MREALIVWGGWSGHEPEQCARIYKDWLEGDGFKVYVEDTTEAFADPSIHDLSLIIPIPVHGGRPVGGPSGQYHRLPRRRHQAG